MEVFLKAVRRRLRLAWAVATGQLLAPAALGVAVALTGAGRIRPIEWADRAALVAVGLALVALLAAALTRRVPLSVAARAADRGLGAHDAFATALELGPPASAAPRGSGASREPGDLQPGALADRVRQRAGSLASGRSAREAVRLHVNPGRLAVSGLLVLVALGLGVLPNPQDEIARRHAAEQALLEQQSRRLAEAAAQLQKTAQGRAQQAAAQELERAARELRAAHGLEAGKQALDRSAARLARQIDPNLLGMKAAVRGLDRSLAAAPLPGLGGARAGSAASQLSAAARSLAGMTPEQRSALAARLDALAGAQRAGDPSTAESLQSAAGALRNGDLAAAAGALARATTGHAGSAGAVQDQEGAAGALGSLAVAADALAAGPGAQQGSGLGNGRGQANGQGQAGRGPGNGHGRGNGQGRGTGRQQGSGGGGAGRVTGNNATTGSGQGGTGTAAGTGRNATVGVQTATVYDPSVKGRDGDQLGVQGRPGDGPGQVVGQGDLTDPANAPLVPLAQAFPRYQEQASEALSRLDIPPSMRAVVRSYFESLGTR